MGDGGAPAEEGRVDTEDEEGYDDLLGDPDDGVPEDAREYVDEAYADAMMAYVSGEPVDAIMLADYAAKFGRGGEHARTFALALAEARHRAGMEDEAMEAALEAARGKKGAGPRSLALRLAGDISRSRGDRGAALKYYEEAAEGSDSAELYWTLARKAAVLLELGRHAECLEAAGRALAEAEDAHYEVASAGAAHELRAAGLLGLGRHKEALAAAERGLGEDPGSAALGALRAAALADAGGAEDALAAANGAIKADHASAVAWYAKARLLARAGKEGPALDALTVAVSLDPSNVRRARDEADFGPVRGAERFARLAG